jgi:ribosomal protein S18 acetylase RimI-like enzyme
MIGSWGDDSPGTKARRRAMKESYIAWEQYPDEDCYLITGLYVRPEERRQGKATKMLREALDEMRAERAFDCVRLSADSQAQDSRDPIDEAGARRVLRKRGLQHRVGWRNCRHAVRFLKQPQRQGRRIEGDNIMINCTPHAITLRNHHLSLGSP